MSRSKCLLAIVAFIGMSCVGMNALEQGSEPREGAVDGVDHVLLTVADLDKSIQFYRDVLGLQAQAKSSHFATLYAGRFGVFLSDKPWDFEKRGDVKGVGILPHFTTPSISDLERRLKRHGVAWLRGPVQESFGVEAFFVDPDGYQWAVVGSLDEKATTTEPNEKSMCPVHHVSLVKDEVTIFHGIIDGIPPNLGGGGRQPDENEADAQRTKFPFHAMHIYKGCVNTDGERKTGAVWCCPECRAARRNWFKAQYGWSDAEVERCMMGR